MSLRLYLILLIINILIDGFDFRFDDPKNIYRALSSNENLFDYGFTTTYVGVEPFEFEHYLFIRKHFWKIKQEKTDQKDVCIVDLESQQHKEFDAKFTLAFSYLSEHMVKHSDELNLTNHVLLQFSLRSSDYYAEFESHEIIEQIFDANHKNLHYMVGGDYYVFPIPHFNASVAFQPQSFTDNEETDGPNFVFVQQNMTEEGYVRQSEVHSIIDEVKFRNTTEQFGQYIPPFIQSVDPHLYINAILPTRLREGKDDKSAIIILLHDNGLIKYCVTEEETLDESCKPSNLRQLLLCIPEKDEL